MAKALKVISQFFNQFILAGCVYLLPLAYLASAAESVEESISLIAKGHSHSAESQRKIDALSNKTLDVVDSILQNDRQSKITEAYNEQLEKLIQSQNKEVEALKVQINSIEETEQAMLPLLSVMVRQLSQLVGLDVPFLLEERLNRVEKLRYLLDRADVSVAEKYRQILEAYLIEVGYGRTIEAYSGILNESKHVNYLRIGRVALYYQDLNGQSGGLWLPAKGLWQDLSSEQNRVVSKAIQIALQQRIPELLPLPIPTNTIY